MAEITILGKEYTLPEGITVVGRGEDADIKIDSTKLSRVHARFTVSGAMIAVEDLGSKNGTFVNGLRLEARRELIRGDMLKFGDVECTVKYPGAGLEQKPDAQPPAPAKTVPAAGSAAVRPARGGRRGQMELIKKAVTLTIVVIGLLVGYRYYKNYEPAELKEARLLLEEADAYTAEIQPGGNAEDNRAILVRVQAFQARLGQVLPEYRERLPGFDSTAAALADLAAAAEARNAELTRTAEAQAAYEAVTSGLAGKRMTVPAALEELKRICAVYAGTEAAARAEVRITELTQAEHEAELAGLNDALRQIRRQAEDGSFREALEALAALKGRVFVYLTAAERAVLDPVAGEVEEKAAVHFSEFTARAESRARTGDCRALQQELTVEYERIGIDALNDTLQQSLARIEQVRQERIAQARQELEKDFAEVERLEQKRLYREAVEKCAAILPRVTEPELQKELGTRKRDNAFYAAAKDAVIAYVNAAGGIDVTGMGRITRMSNETLELSLEGVSMPLGWEKLRDGEYLGLLTTAVNESGTADALMGYALLLLGQNRIDEAAKVLARVQAMQPDYVTACADIFARAVKEEKPVKPAREEKAITATSTVKATLIPTYHCLSVYWSPEQGAAERKVLIQFRESGQKRWREGFPMRYHPVKTPECKADYRGSIVNLTPGTTYDIVLTLEGTDLRTVARESTWNEQPPIASTVKGSDRKVELVINRSGSPNGWVLFDGTGCTIDTENKANHGISITGSYIIVRGYTIRNVKLHGIRIFGDHHIIIEDCDISKWGSEDENGFGGDYQGAVFSNNQALNAVVIQRNKMHHPSWDSNSWAEEHNNSRHPAGQQTIVFWESAGNHVFRYNECWSDEDHYFNDIMGAGNNGSYRGFPGADSDIYGNYLANCWDDGIEAEGAGQNVRIWNNYIENVMMVIGNAAVSIGPYYVWRNVSGRSYSPPGSSWDLSHGCLFKMGYADSENWMTGTQYIFNNTILQPEDGGAGGLGGSSKPIKHCTSRNNILHIHKDDNRSISTESEASIDNDFDYDLVTGRYPSGQEKHVINGAPKYVPGAGFVFETMTGIFQLASGSPGYDRGTVIPNFCDVFKGSAPDVGAHEAGTPPMIFGVKAEFIPPGGTN